MALKGALPFPAHFLVIRKWPQCRQVDGDPRENVQIWRILKLDNKAVSDREGNVVRECFLNRSLILSLVVRR